MPITITTHVHFCMKEVPDYYRKNPGKAVNVMAFSKNLSDVWEKDWRPHYGTLLKVVQLDEDVDHFDPIKVEVDNLRKDITRIQAESEMAIKEKRDRMNDLLQIGYDFGTVVEISVTEVTDVEAKVVTPGEDDDIPF